MMSSDTISSIQTEAPPRKGTLARALALPSFPRAEASAGAFALPRNLGRLAVVAVELALVLALFRAFDLEASSGFGRVAPMLFGGFIVHAALPLRFRLPFFLALSLAALRGGASV